MAFDCHLWVPSGTRVCSLSPGVQWLPDEATFDRLQEAQIEGRWAPCPWLRGPAIHLVCMCEELAFVHVLVMAPRGTQCQRWPRYPSQQDVSARVRGYGMLSWVIPGYTHSGDWQRPELVLRDGDVVQSHARKPLPPARGVARRHQALWGPGILVASLLYSPHSHKGWMLVLLAQSIAAVQVPPTRSRSPVRSSDLVHAEDDSVVCASAFMRKPPIRSCPCGQG